MVLTCSIHYTLLRVYTLFTAALYTSDRPLVVLLPFKVTTLSPSSLTDSRASVSSAPVSQIIMQVEVCAPVMFQLMFPQWRGKLLFSKNEEISLNISSLGRNHAKCKMKNWPL